MPFEEGSLGNFVTLSILSGTHNLPCARVRDYETGKRSPSRKSKCHSGLKREIKMEYLPPPPPSYQLFSSSFSIRPTFFSLSPLPLLPRFDPPWRMRLGNRRVTATKGLYKSYSRRHSAGGLASAARKPFSSRNTFCCSHFETILFPFPLKGEI